MPEPIIEMDVSKLKPNPTDVVSHHSVTNKGLTDRYNLVVDVFVNQKIKELLNVWWKK